MAGLTCLVLLTGKIHVFLQDGRRQRAPEKALEKQLTSHPLPSTQVGTDVAQVWGGGTHSPAVLLVVWLCSGRMLRSEWEGVHSHPCGLGLHPVGGGRVSRGHWVPSHLFTTQGALQYPLE